MKRTLKTPLLPTKKATVAVSADAKDVISSLERLGYDVFTVESNPKMNRPVASHPDCNILQLDDSTFVCDENLTDLLLKYIKENNIVNYLTIGEEIENKVQIRVYSEKICSPYPGEIAINVKRLNNCIVCNTKYTSNNIQAYSAAKNINLYHCNQGYVGCSTVLVSDNAAITDDESVYDTFNRIGIDCLMLSKGQIKLNGYEYGFIGGCCGFIDKKLIAFNGMLSSHKDEKKIKAFLDKYNVDYVELNNNALTDIGGIMPLFEEFN